MFFIVFQSSYYQIKAIFLFFMGFNVFQKPSCAGDTTPRLLQPSPAVTEPTSVRRKRARSSVSFLSDAMEGAFILLTVLFLYFLAN